MSPSRVWADVGTGLGGVTEWHICEGSRQLADRLLIRSTRWARPVRRPGDRSDERHALSGQIDDCCPACGDLVRQRIQADGSVTEECGCGWSVTWQASPAGDEQ